MNACVNCHNKYIDQYNGAGSNYDGFSKQYYEELKLYHYSSFILPDDLKKLRNNYLHWSSKSNLIGYSPYKPGPLPQNERKRNIQDG